MDSLSTPAGENLYRRRKHTGRRRKLVSQTRVWEGLRDVDFLRQESRETACTLHQKRPSSRFPFGGPRRLINQEEARARGHGWKEVGHVSFYESNVQGGGETVTQFRLLLCSAGSKTPRSSLFMLCSTSYLHVVNPRETHFLVSSASSTFYWVHDTMQRSKLTLFCEMSQHPVTSD